MLCICAVERINCETVEGAVVLGFVSPVVNLLPLPLRFRYLRIRQTGRNSSSSEDLYISGFEVYGKFLNSLKKIKVPPPEENKKAKRRGKNRGGKNVNTGNNNSGAQSGFLPAV